MKLLIAGDYCPRQRAAERMSQGDYGFVLGEVRPIVEDADYSIVNLECPVTHGNEKTIIKNGPSLCCSEVGIDALKWAGFDCVTLANNHFRDYGDSGVANTLKKCNEVKIDTVGGGADLKEASKTIYKQIKGKTLAIINCCEHEFSIATDLSAGSNPLNPIRQYYDIKEARVKADYVLVIVHGGNEYYQLPSPRMKETYRFFIDAGADAVVNHHQHCYSGYEFYKEKPIVYGLGNFCFDNQVVKDCTWNEGYMVYINFCDKISFEAIPYIQCGTEPVVQRIGESECEKFKNQIDYLNSIIADDKLLFEKYNLYLDESESIIRVLFSPYMNRTLRGFCRRHLIPSFVTSKKKIELLSYIQCESHLVKIINFLKK